jgi:IS605 OrfB family transposase
MNMRTVSVKLMTTPEQSAALADTRTAFVAACNRISLIAAEQRVWNRVALHHLVYYKVRADSPLGSQMVCNAVKAVADVYRVRKLKRTEDVKPSVFRQAASIHYDARTYRLTDGAASLYTTSGRVLVPLAPGDFQRSLLVGGKAKEAKLLQRGGTWHLNIVVEIPDSTPSGGNEVLGVDLGENVIAATSTGKLFGGGALRDCRDRHLALRRRLQANGSQSARQRLRRVSGREARHMTHVNHEVSKAVVAEAVRIDAGILVMEDLTHIRSRIRAGKRMRSRLHRWAWAELQRFIEYKALAAGLRVVYANPAYTSQTCYECGSIGARVRHRFSCSNCGIQRHSDANAALNLRRIGMSADFPTGEVTRPNVAA